jgi:hypothetical protein
MALRLRRGTDAERLLITPLQGELIYATDTKKIYVGDGAAVGGLLVGPFAATAFDLVNDITPQLGGDLVLNGNNITGTGNINIDGTITATGNIGLGDADADEITVLGVINSDLRPALNISYDLGTEARRWRSLNATEVIIDDLRIAGDISRDDSTLLYNGATDTVSTNNVIAQNIQGNLVGSVFSDDSATVLVDGTNSVLSNGVLSLTNKFIRADGDGLEFDELVLDTSNVTQHAYGISADDNDMGFLSILGSRGTREVPTTALAGDLVGSFNVSAWNGSDSETKTLISTGIDTVTGSNTLPAKMLLTVHDYNGNYSTFGSLDSRGTFEMPTFRATPYADATARDAVIVTPLAGMIVYITSTNKLQCYNGSSWSDLF